MWATARLEGLPTRVTICVVGPRDGLPNEATILPVEIKVEFIQRLVAAGRTVVETTSFVHPKWVPSWPTPSRSSTGSPYNQAPAIRSSFPNARGLDRALEPGVTDIAIFGSTETFAQRNLNRSVDEAAS